MATFRYGPWIYRVHWPVGTATIPIVYVALRIRDSRLSDNLDTDNTRASRPRSYSEITMDDAVQETPMPADIFQGSYSIRSSISFTSQPHPN